MASSSNGLSEAEIQMNLKALKKVLFVCFCNRHSNKSVCGDEMKLCVIKLVILSLAGPVYPGYYGTQQPGSLLYKIFQLGNPLINAQVQLYKYISKNSSDGDWVQTKV